jgi:hypothetical protein
MPRLARGIRRESTETGEDKTGHISASSNEGILFFDSESVVILPFKHVSLNFLLNSYLRCLEALP